ncbi:MULTISPECIES: YpiB family protein [Geobacillus]|uniref:IDEAL domain-containing protein n=1 Tax=Bacillus caldolyticus TaxID=1394 RepID=A0ABM6QJY1_BACCL|nr:MULTISPECIES: YpiB family protein [Geobacillus]AKM18693.1 hypothetical protein GARCT_01401 [Geobacillus sp. 12AMOR1]KFL15300.1 hypothetical protein ET31_12965 [Geobacillus stearothermophilus]MED0653103.1 YpiB family protein [Anoxybacillus geothermalis]STO11910.1 Uncharacterized conserved protein [[Flavobacterium] thermophilum]AUI35659.1 hypothetical protein CWI35_03200 [[Bacillus] caldolyticus]
MTRWVSYSEKRQFLTTFLQQHRLKHPDARFVLQYLLQHPHLLENVHFTETEQKQARWLIISTAMAEEEGLVFYRRGQKSTSLASIMGDLALHPNEPLYLTLHFPGKARNFSYLRLIDHQAFENVRRHERHEKMAKAAEQVLDEALKRHELSVLKMQIDQALDRKDMALFQQLTEQLKKYEGQNS